MQLAGCERVTLRYVDLKDLTIVCTLDELGMLANFFQNTYEDALQVSQDASERDTLHHTHYQDFCAEWVPAESDLVITTIFEKKGKNGSE